MGKKSSSYQQIDPRVGQAMLRQAELAQEYQDWYETEMVPSMFAATERANERQYALANFSRDLARYQRDQTQARTDKYNARADEAWETAMDMKSVDADIAREARDYNEAANAERLSEGAMGDLTMAYGQQRKGAAQQYNNMGVDPTSGRYQAGFRQISDDEANNKAQARLAAERAAKELGWNKRMTAVGIGQDYINQSNNYGNLANNTISSGMGQVLASIGSASGSAQTQLSNLNNMYNSYGNNLTSLMNQNQSVFNTGMGVSNTNLQQSIATNQNNATMAQGYGNLAGSMAGFATNLATTKLNTGSWTGR